MKPLLFALTTLFAAGIAGAQTDVPPTQTTTAETKTDVTTTTDTSHDSPLVKAAKANNGGSTKKIPKKVIRNADLKKEPKGTASATKPATSTAPPAGEPKKGIIEQQDELHRARGAAQVRVDTAQKKVDGLDKELKRLEQAYYDEGDPNYRDKTLTERFQQTKRQLETARKELADARDALDALNK